MILIKLQSRRFLIFAVLSALSFQIDLLMAADPAEKTKIVTSADCLPGLIDLGDVKPSAKKLSVMDLLRSAEGQSVKYETEKIRFFGADPEAYLPLISKMGIAPKLHDKNFEFKMEKASTQFVFGRPFFVEGRPFVIGLVKTRNNDFCMRVFYQSRSASRWRVLPALIKKGNRAEYDKAAAEEALNTPHEVNDFLNTLTEQYKISTFNLSPGEQELEVLGGAVPVIDEKSPELTFYKVPTNGKKAPYHLKNKVKSVKILHNSVNVREAFVWDPLPNKAILEGPDDNPDFTRELSKKIEMSPQLGRITKYVYASKNERLHYEFIEQMDTGKVGVSDVHFPGVDMTSWGVWEWAVNDETLTMPLLEYYDQIPDKFKPFESKDYVGYASAWNYIRDIPMIKRWYEFKKREIPKREGL
ncbi:MAG: hypothetical protein JWQ35_2504 [Bacteriovoracaceae bacterium]|nr:hypothetical protein [Bacteriovoracaceae bacterium]